MFEIRKHDATGPTPSNDFEAFTSDTIMVMYGIVVKDACIFESFQVSCESFFTD